jgi:phosphonoacetate hydrolase
MRSLIGLVPDVLYLRSLFDEWLGADQARVILPITDSYVVHHGALGSFATVYLADSARAQKLSRRLAKVKGVEAAYTNAEGCVAFDLPNDRLSDLIVVSTTNKVLGTTPERHDRSQLREPLRSHGGVCDRQVPLVFSQQVEVPGLLLHNYDLFNLALNHTY